MLTLCFDLSAAEPKNIFSNGMFESADGAFPAGWGDIQYRQKTVKALAVKKHAMLGGKDGIELPTIPEGNQPQAFVGFAQGIGLEELKAPRNAIVRIDMACQNVAHGNVVAYANGKDNKLIYWKPIGQVSGNIGLRTYEFIAEIPAGAKYLNVSFRNFGAGTLWLTNARLYWEEDAPKLSKTPAASTTLLLNPAMEGATAGTLPKGWSRFFYPGKEAEGRIEIQNGTCSLTHVGGAFGFGVESALLGNISPMHVYPIEARYKTLNGAKFQISAEFRDAAGGTLGEQLSPLFDSPVEAVAKWQAKAPKEARTLSLRWLNADKGTVVFTAPSCTIGDQIQENAVERFPISVRVFPAEWTRDFSSKPYFFTFRNTEMPLSIELCGDRTKLKEPVVFLEFPDCLEVSCYSSYPTVQYYKDLPGEIVSKEKGRITLKLADIPLWSILNKHFGAQRTVIANIRGPNAALQSGPHIMRIWAENNGRKGDVHELEILLLDDPKKVELPKSFYIGRWSTMDSFPFKEEIFERMVEAQSRCGYRQASLPWGDNPHLLKYIAALRKKGWTIACNHVDDHPAWTFPDYTQPKAIDPNGTPYPNHVCPEQLIDNPHTYAQIRKILDGYLKHMKAGDMALLDNEPFETMEWCFCDYCRAKFAKRFNLDTVPSGSEIRLKHREKWITFRCENTREVTRHYADGLRERLPGLNVLQYDYVIDYTNPKAPMAKFSSVCLDPAMNDPFLQGHLQSYYHFFDFEGFRMMRVNHARFNAPYIPMGAISGTAEGYLNKSEALSPSRIRLMVLAAAVNGCNSYWFYRGTADARYLLRFQNALNAIARLEKEPLWKNLAFDEAEPKLKFAFRPYGKIALPDGKSIDTPDWKDLATAVQASNKSHSLAAIFNFHDKPLFTDVSSSAYSGAIVIENVLTGDILFKGDARQLRSSVLLCVHARNALFVKIRPAKQTDKASAFSQEDFETEFKRICDGTTIDAFKPMNAEGFTIDPAVVDGKPGLTIFNENGSFSVNMFNGGIQDWKVKGKELPGNWGRTHIWLPQSLNSATYPWKLGARIITKGYASVELSFEMDDVAICKELQLEKDGRVRVILEFKNNSQKPVTMTPKFSQLLNSPEFFGKDGKPIALTFKETVVESTKGRHDGFSDSLVRDLPAVTHGMYTKVNGTRINCSFSKEEQGMLFYFWKSASTTECTWEHVWLPADVQPGKFVYFTCVLQPIIQ